MCQTFGLPSSVKYESDGGPGIARIMAFLMGSSEALRDRYDFMKFQVFQCTTIMTANDWILPWFILVRIMYIMLNYV